MKEGRKNTCKKKEEPKELLGDWSREHEPEPVEIESREDEPDSVHPDILANVTVWDGCEKGLSSENFGKVFGEPHNLSGKAEKQGSRVVAGEQVVKGRSPSLGLNPKVNHCPTGCPPQPVNRGARAMADYENAKLKLAAVKGGGGPSTNLRSCDVSSLSSDQTQEVRDLWNDPFFFRKPGGSKDQWISSRLGDGWLVRAHPETRVRTFQPIHRGVPIDPKKLTGKRVTVSYDEEGQRTVWEDEWTNPTKNLHDPKRLWTGWTFLELKKPEKSNFGEKHVEEIGEVPDHGERVIQKEKEDVEVLKNTEGYASGSSGTTRMSGALQSEKGYQVGTIEEKGKLVARQSPLHPSTEKTFTTEVTDDDGSEWAFVTDFEKVG